MDYYLNLLPHHPRQDQNLWSASIWQRELQPVLTRQEQYLHCSLFHYSFLYYSFSVKFGWFSSWIIFWEYWLFRIVVVLLCNNCLVNNQWTFCDLHQLLIYSHTTYAIKLSVVSLKNQYDLNVYCIRTWYTWCHMVGLLS